MLISDHLTYEIVLDKSQLEEMLETSGVNEGRINPSHKVIVDSFEQINDELRIQIQVLQKQDA